VLPIGEFRQLRSGPLMLLFANSLDGVRGWFSFRDPARHGRPGGDFPCGADTRHSRRAPQFERRTIVGTAAPSCPAERRSAHCSALLSAIKKNFDGGRASQPVKVRALARFQIPSPHHEPRSGGRLGCPAERSSARCSDTSVRHLQKNFGGGRASPPVQVQALACFQIPLPPP